MPPPAFKIKARYAVGFDTQRGWPPDDRGTGRQNRCDLLGQDCAWQWQPAAHGGSASVGGVFRGQAVAFRSAARAGRVAVRKARLGGDAADPLWRNPLLRRSCRGDRLGAACRRRRLRQEPDPGRGSLSSRAREGRHGRLQRRRRARQQARAPPPRRRVARRLRPWVSDAALLRGYRRIIRSKRRRVMVQAIRFAKTGGPEVLEWQQVEVGKPGQGQVRLRHTAVGLNYIDPYQRSGPYPMPLPSGL